jgi:hypothetical protein
MTMLLLVALAALAGCSCRDDPAAKLGSEDSGLSDDGLNDDTAAPCVPEVAEFTDWMALGEFGSGRTQHAGTMLLDGVEMPLELQVSYPAEADGEDTALAAGGPFPVVFFEHAYGADYLNSDWLLDRLASRGFVVFSVAHNGVWDGAGDWWNDHAALFLETADLAAAWDGDADSPFHGALDLDTTALMGHSHGGGAALHAMDALDVDAVVLITVRPSLDGSYSAYHDRYDGMPPLLNVVASRDEDGTTAYGTSIAVYEALTRPRFMVTVEGASHYTFTDEASIAPSSIEREAGQVAGGSAIVAFLEYRLHGDARGLHSLRGDVALHEDGVGAPTRNQSHLDGAWVIDDFENTISAEGTAIAGIAGQTFVNGFMGDTFADFDGGVALLTAEIEALSDPGDAVLFYQDASRSTDAYAAALAGLDRELTALTSDAEFAEELSGAWEAGAWDLVVATQQDGNTSDTRPFDDELAAWICSGGKAILSDFRYTSSTAAETFACAGAAFDGTTNWTTMTGQGALFEGDMRVQNPGWGVFSTGLYTTETVYATNNTTTVGVPDPTVGPLGSVVATGLDTFDEMSALDRSRFLTMPTQALELAWSGEGRVRWEVDLDASDWATLSLRALQVHDDEGNDGDLTFRVEVEDAAGNTASQSVTVGETLDWLESTVPKSVFETFRLPLADFDGVDVARIAAVTLVFEGTGRVLVDDLELSPGLGCESGQR